MAAMFANESRQNVNLHRESSIDYVYSASVHVAKGFRRRRLECGVVTGDERQTTETSDDKSSRCLWQGELRRTIKRNSQHMVQRQRKTKQNTMCGGHH
jgi:hypothetical protein